MAKKKKSGFKAFVRDYRLEIGAVGLVLLLWGLIWAWDSNKLQDLTTYFAPTEEVTTDDTSSDDASAADTTETSDSSETDSATGE